MKDLQRLSEGGQVRVESRGKRFVSKFENAKTVIAASEVETAGALAMKRRKLRIGAVRGDLLLHEGKGVGPEALRGQQEQFLIVGRGLEKNLKKLQVGGEGLLRQLKIPLPEIRCLAVLEDLRCRRDRHLPDDRAAGGGNDRHGNQEKGKGTFHWISGVRVMTRVDKPVRDSYPRMILNRRLSVSWRFAATVTAWPLTTIASRRDSTKAI